MASPRKATCVNANRDSQAAIVRKVRITRDEITDSNSWSVWKLVNIGETREERSTHENTFPVSQTCFNNSLKRRGWVQRRQAQLLSKGRLPKHCGLVQVQVQWWLPRWRENLFRWAIIYSPRTWVRDDNLWERLDSVRDFVSVEGFAMMVT